ncbi:MAG TPA: hypothetical protein VGP13_03005 [Candidatus Paceibacterota bacterium]|jgi:hypothetical protein|nr:hypothetical protein [Candidatus Paceibacterota bacterium]
MASRKKLPREQERAQKRQWSIWFEELCHLYRVDQPIRLDAVAYLARRGLSAPLIGRVLNTTRGTELRRAQDNPGSIKLKGNEQQYIVRNRFLFRKYCRAARFRQGTTKGKHR